MNILKITLATIFASFLFLSKPKPTLYIIGDSTVKNSTGNTEKSLWGWGSLIGSNFDTTRISVENHAIGGRSSRTFINEGRWKKILATLKKGDYLIMQFGHNDSGPLADTARARGSIKGIVADSSVIYNPKLKRQETVYTYGAYLRKYVREAREKGAVPIICSPVSRNIWKNNKVVGSDYQIWAKQIAEQMNAFYIPLNETIAQKYEAMGTEKVKLFFPVDHTHTNKEGAVFNASLVIEGIKATKKCELKRYLNN